MSEFLAEARILVRPDTSRFRVDLEAQLKSVLARPVKIPVVPVVSGNAFAATIAGTAALTSAQQSAAAATTVTSDALATATTIQRNYAGAVDLSAIATNNLAAAQTREAAAASESAAANAAAARNQAGLARGAGASALTMLGLRGATLAASGAFLAGTAAVVGFSKAVQSAASLETELNVFRVTAGATADEMQRVSDTARLLGRDLTLPGVTANDAAVALTELSKAGLSVEDSLAGARGALQLATAAQIDNVTATKLVAGALNAFQLAGTDAVRVADLLTGAAKESQGEISDMGTALSQVAAVSQQFGVSIGDTVTLLTELAQAGLSGGRAGTSLRVAFLRLVNPTADAAKALDNLNVAVRDANGNLRPGVFTDIADALQGYTKAQRDATLATIFGSDAIRAAAIIGNKGTLAFLQTSAAINEVGLAQEQAAARTSGLQGATENLKNQMSALGLTIGELSTGPLTAIAAQFADLLKNANATAEGLVTLSNRINVVGKDMAGQIPIVGSYTDKLGSIADKVIPFLNPMTAGFQASGAAVKAFGLEVDNNDKKLDPYASSVNDVSKAIGDLGTSLLQSAADSKIFTQQVTTDTQNLLQSAADSRIGSNGDRFTAPKPQVFPVQRIQNIVQGFNDKQIRDKIAGDNAKLLADLEAEQAFLIKELQKQGVKNRPALQRSLEQALLGAQQEIQSIQDKEKARNDALKSAAQRIADERKRALEEAAKKIRDAQAAAAKKAADAAKEQQRLQEQQRQDLLRGLDLNIEFAQITDDQKAEVVARNKKIAELTRELKAEAKAHGKTTLAYKEIRNEIAAQTAAIDEITKAKQKQNVAQSLSNATFDFLQTQQGFASNLLGNLIPSAATGGLVGGGSPVEQALTPVAGFADAQGKSGPTSGQAQTTNGLLLAILAQMKQLNGDNTAPEAQRQNRGQRAVMDGVGGG